MRELINNIFYILGFIFPIIVIVKFCIYGIEPKNIDIFVYLTFIIAIILENRRNERTN